MKNTIKDLSNEIHEENINKFINEFDKAMSKEINNIIKKIFLLLGIIALSFGFMFIINNPISFIFGFLIMSTGILKLTLDQNDHKNLNKNKIVEIQKRYNKKNI